MKLTRKGKTFALLLILSALFAYLVIFPYYFPYFGITVSLILFAFFTYKIKENRNRVTKLFFTLTILFAAMISIRSEGLLTFFNVMAALYFGSLMMLVNEEKEVSGLGVISAPFFLVLKGLFTSSKYELEFKEKPNNILGQIDNVLAKIVTLAITIIILLSVPPILASANPIFSDQLDAFYNLFNLRRLFDFLFTINNILLLQRLLFFFALLLLLPRMITYMNGDNEIYIKQLKGVQNLNLTLPKIVTAIILFLFFITQFQLYFSSQETLAQMGYSYSDYTNEVFAQLSVVSIIIILLMHIENRSGRYTKILNYLLILLGVFLTFMAFKSVYEYSYTYGFTYKRLYGFAVTALLLGTYLLQYLSYYKKLSKDKFVYLTALYGGMILLIVNLINFDYLIYHYRKSVTGQGVDHEYLSRLSSDSLSYNEQLVEIEKLYNEAAYPDKDQLTISGNNLVWRIEKLQIKYMESDLRKFNLLEYMQYQEIKDVDIEKYGEIFSNTYQLPRPGE